MASSIPSLSLRAIVSTKVRRFILVVVVHLIALVISWWNLSRIYPQDVIPFFESIGVSLLLGFTALPLSAAHLVLNMGDEGIITVAGRPNLFISELIISLLVFLGFLFFIIKGKKLVGAMAAIYMLIAAPYWAYYSFALMGI